MIRVLNSFVYYIKGIYLRFKEDEILLYASGIAFNGLLCLIPLFLLVTSLFGIFLQSFELAVQRIDEVLTQAFPPQPYAQDIKEAIRRIIDDIIQYRGSFGFVGIVILTWTAAYLFNALRTALNRIYRLKPSSFVLLSILKDLGWVILVVVLFFITNIVPGILSLIEFIVREVPVLQMFNVEALWKMFPLAVNFILTFLMFFILYRFVPRKGISGSVAVVSALTTSFLWVAAGLIFRWFLTTFHSFGELYGAYAFLLVMLFWVYYSSLVFLIGAIVGQLYSERHQR